MLFWAGYVLAKLGGPLLLGQSRDDDLNVKAVTLSGLAILALFLADQAIHGRF